MSTSLGELRRVLGPLTGVAVSVGVAVGAGILRAPGEVAAKLPAVPWIFAAWLLGALMAVLDGLILAEMASSVPRVGGLVAYVRLSFGPRVAFVVGWAMLIVGWPASLAAVAVVVGELVTGGHAALVGGGTASNASIAVAVAVIAAAAGLNLFGLRAGARAEIALLLLKVALLSGICVAAWGAVAFGGAGTAVAVPAGPPLELPTSASALLAAVGGAMIGVHFTYDGYADAVYLAGETRDPGRAMPRALFASLLTITVLYLLANAAFLAVLGTQGLARSAFPALDVVRAAFGDRGAAVLTVVAVVVLLGAVNAYFLTGPRIARVLAEEGLAVPVFGRVSAHGANAGATVWIAAVASAFALTGSFGRLLDLVVPVIAATTIAVAIGLLVQRARAPLRVRPFRTPCAWLVVALQTGLGLFLLVGFVRNNADAVLFDAGAIAVGLVVYQFVVRPRLPSA